VGFAYTPPLRVYMSTSESLPLKLVQQVFLLKLVARSPYPLFTPLIKMASAELMSSLRATFSQDAHRFRGRRAVVTGGAGGIGEACVRQLAAEAASVAILDVAAPEVGIALARDVQASAAASGVTGIQILYVRCDVSDEAATAAAFEQAEHELGGGIDVLVCMAACFVYAQVHEATFADWDRAVGINIKGTAAAIKAVIPGMRERRRGAIVLTSSITATLAFPGFVPYSATKAAIIQMTRDIALDNGSYGIRVNCCAPGPIFTLGGTVAHASQQGMDLDKLCGDLAADVSLRRMGTVAECAKAVAFLASDDASYVTGTTLHVDGGFYRK
jgi:meso-butanediol dehydrogenase / (S,S)-butanediol dehydrogenase / diacetyl reductase